MSKHAFGILLTSLFVASGCATSPALTEKSTPVRQFRAAPQLEAPLPPPPVVEPKTPVAEPKPASFTHIGCAPAAVPVLLPEAAIDTVSVAKFSDEPTPALPDADAAIRLAEAVRGMVREVSAAVTDLEAVPKSLGSIIVSAAPVKNDAVQPAEGNPTTPALGLWKSLWLSTTPIWGAIGAYVVAPLLVDMLKRRIKVSRRRNPVATL